MAHLIIELLELCLLVWIALRAGLPFSRRKEAKDGQGERVAILSPPDNPLSQRRRGSADPLHPQGVDGVGEADITEGIVNLMSYSVNVKQKKEDET